MKIPLSWLQEHLRLDPALDLDALEEAMTMAGLEVESRLDMAAKLAAFTVAHVIEAGPHPDADKLKVCRVATRDGEKQIVCGAPNARTGLVGVYAPLGAFIPGLDFALDKKPRKIRGVESHGMLCSARELESGEDHDGVIDLAGDWPVGAPAAEALGLDDPVIDIEVTPNRPDWLGIEGIARDLAAAGCGTFTPQPIAPVPGTFPCPTTVRIEDPDFCPAFALRLVRGVKNGPSPDWLQAKLRAVGLRPINALVDVTNLLTLDRARPLHVFDAAKVKGDLVVRRARDGESLSALDGKTYALGPDVGVIADEEGVESLAGVMGGEETGCDPDTTDVLIESALWDPLTIARTGRALGLTSDAQYRFARGVDPAFTIPGMELATALILQICGGEASEIRLAGAIPDGPGPIAFEPASVARLTGLTPAKAEIAALFEALGCTIKGVKTKSWRVQPPTWRRDLVAAADLVEEAARLIGYDKLPATSLPPLPGRRKPAMSATRRRVESARRALAGRGLSEAVTWSFVDAGAARLFGGDPDGLELANPISSELTVMRPSALPHLIAAVGRNADRGFPGAAVFEVGPAYRGVGETEQEMVAAGVRDPRTPRHWAGGAAVDAFAAKADALAALTAAGAPVDSLQVATPAEAWWHPGRSGVLQLGPKKRLASFGALHPGILKALDVEGPLYAFEVFLDRLAPAKTGVRARPSLDASDLMPLHRDFAFVVDAAVPAQDLARAAAGADRALIAGVGVFDVYDGEGVGADRKSIALEVRLQPRETTLDDAAIEAVSDKIVKAVAKATGATLRA